MTKKEIYERVVQLTAELAKTKVAERIFDAAAEGNVAKTQKIIDIFPSFYPGLYQRIVEFGIEFNRLIGESKEDRERRNKILESCEVMMYALAETEIIAKIARAVEAGEADKVQEVIGTFLNEYEGLSKNLVYFQEEYLEYRKDNKTGLEGAIFGVMPDEANGVFVFDPDAIDTLSFYVSISLLTFLMCISSMMLRIQQVRFLMLFAML